MLSDQKPNIARIRLDFWRLISLSDIISIGWDPSAKSSSFLRERLERWSGTLTARFRCRLTLAICR